MCYSARENQGCLTDCWFSKAYLASEPCQVSTALYSRITVIHYEDALPIQPYIRATYKITNVYHFLPWQIRFPTKSC